MLCVCACYIYVNVCELNYVCVFILNMHACVVYKLYVGVFAWVGVCVNSCKCLHVYKCKHVYVCTNVCIVCVHELELLCTYRCMYYACLGVCMSMCMYVVCVCVQVYVHMSSCVGLRGYNVLDSFVRSELSNRRFGFVPVMDPIHWRFKYRPMR